MQTPDAVKSLSVPREEREVSRTGNREALWKWYYRQTFFKCLFWVDDLLLVFFLFLFLLVLVLFLLLAVVVLRLFFGFLL